MRKALAVALAAGISLGLGAAVTPAVAADVTPAQVAGDHPQATIRPLDAPITNSNEDRWRRTVAASPYRDRIDELAVYSPSMGRDIPVAVFHAPIDNAPTLYLLNGAGGAEQGMDWFTASNVLEFYADKNVNLVVPMQGAFSYYIDWYSEPNGAYRLQGPQKWETFLTKELPGPIEQHLSTDGQRGIIGFSMSATSSLLLAEHNPGFYDAVGSFSGCAATSDPVSYFAHGVTGDFNSWNATMGQMFGPQGSAHNRYNDALLNTEGLRGTDLYISNSSGLAGRSDQQSHIAGLLNPEADEATRIVAASANAANLQLVGGGIEAFTNKCTHDLKAKLDSQNIPADYNFRTMGTHSWAYWEQDLVDSWPTFWRSFWG